MTPQTPNSLTSAAYWDDQFWTPAAEAADLLTFDPQHPEFRDLHRFFRTCLPRDPAFRFLEVGCHPGRYLWYFRKYFDYRVAGIEYAPRACERTRQTLAHRDIPADVIQADLFTYRIDDADRYDVVASFGVVEHFVDIVPPLQAHVNLLKPGGYLVITTPNHHGVNGPLLRWLQPDVYTVHNHMDYWQLREAVRSIPGLDLVAGGYLGRFNLAPSNFCPTMQQRLTAGQYRWIERAHRWALRFNDCLPNSPWLSPYLGLIARRRPDRNPGAVS